MIIGAVFLIVLLEVVCGRSVVEESEVKLVIFGEGRCRDTTYFFKWHLMPMFHLFGANSGGRLSIEYHPFGVKSSCVENARGEVSCLCHHGERECLLNSLQACVIDTLPNFVDHLEHVGCIQGRENITDAADSCLHDPIFKQKMLECGNSNRGRKLILEKHQKVQEKLVDFVDWVPWISINGERDKNAEDDLWQFICDRYLKPRPEECPKRIYFT